MTTIAALIPTLIRYFVIVAAVTESVAVKLVALLVPFALCKNIKWHTFPRIQER